MMNSMKKAGCGVTNASARYIKYVNFSIPDKIKIKDQNILVLDVRFKIERRKVLQKEVQ